MSSRFVRPETKRLEISGGDWLLVKKRLTEGEQRALFARMYVAGVDGTMRVNPLQTGMALVLAYLLDWSIQDEGKPVPILGKSADDVQAVLDSMDPESFREIKQAIEAHDAAMDQERAAAKNAPDGGNELPAISPSRSGVAGGTSGLVN